MPFTLWKYLDNFQDEQIIAALSAFRQQQPKTALGILALVCEQDSAAIPSLQRSATYLEMPLVGIITPGLVVQTGFRRRGLLLIAFDATTPWYISPLPNQENRTNDAAVTAFADFVATHANDNGEDTLLLFFDGMVPDVASLLDRLYLEIGDQVNYAGICVGSETFQPVPCIFDNERFIQQAVLALILPQHPGAAVAHHYRGSESLAVATATTGSRIASIDGIPAFTIYQKLMASEYGIDLNQENFYRYAVHFPFAINQGQGEPLVRIPVKVEPDGSVFCTGEVKENALLSVVRAVAPGDLRTAEQIGTAAQTPHAAGILSFYCAGRLIHLEEAAAMVELAALAKVVTPAPLFGALCLGEISSGRQQYPVLHNAIIMAMPWT
jgi:hypothetical protein